VGKAGLIKPHLIKPGAVVVDVGINRVPGPDGKSRIVGDVDPSVADIAAALTPVPGGVGALTTTILLEATVDAAERLAVTRPVLDGAALAKVLGVDLAPAVAERLARVVGRHLVSAAGGSARSPFERRLARGVLVLDGAMGSELIARGIPADRIAHATIDHPELVRELHQAYLDAGAEVLTTNTFGVNRCRLNGDRELVVRLATAGVRLARSVAAGRAFILGDLGPLGRMVGADLSVAEAEDIYAEAAAALAEAGADALLIETQPSTIEAAAALAGARRATRLPVLVSRTIAHDDPVELSEFARACEVGGAIAVGINCAAGPRALAPVVARLASLTTLPVLARPNAGHPLRENGRIVYHLRPDYLVARMADYLASGASIIGGCCGVGPTHIAALAKTYANAPLPKRTPGIPVGSPASSTCPPGTADFQSALQSPHPSTTPSICCPDHSTATPGPSLHPLLAAAKAGHFPIIALLPGRLPPTASAAALTRLAQAGAFAVGLLAGWPGAPRGTRLPARLAHLATATGKPAVLDLVAADTTLPAAQDTLLTAHLLGIRTVIIDAGVFSADTRADIPSGCDPAALVALVRRLNQGRDLTGTHLEEPTTFAIGVRIPADRLVATDPSAGNAPTPDDESQAAASFPAALIAAGADFVTLQPIYDPAAFRTAMATLATCPVPIFAEILVLPDAATADELDNELPRLSIPDHLKRRLATDPSDDARGVQRFLHHWRHRLAGAVLMVSDEHTAQAEKILN
jgi:homocysteine S-methyltransferase